MKSKILKGLPIVILLIGCLYIIFLQKQRSDLNYQNISKLNEIDNKKYKLNKELEDLEANYKEESYGKAGITLLIDQTDTTVVSFIYPVLKKMEYKAVLAFDLKHMPGDENTMTTEEFDMLFGEGWSYCIRWDGKSDFDEYMIQIIKRFGEKNMEVPQTLYVGRGYYSEELKEKVKNYNIHNIIHHGENEKSSISIYDKNLDYWELGSIGYLDDLVASYLKIAVEKGGCLVLSIGNESGDELYNMNSMNRILEILKDYENQDKLMVDTIGNIKRYKSDLAKDQDKRTQDYQEESSRVKNELEELEEERELQRDSIN